MNENILKVKEFVPFAKTLRVLYVEDNDDARAQTLKMFNNFFDDITIAVDGEDALEKFNQANDKNEEFDLILSDINMPKMNGVDLLKNIRLTDSSVVFVIISAHNEVEYFSRSIRYGVDGYLLKPINLEQYIELLVKILKKMKNENDNKIYKNKLEEVNTILEKKVEKRTEELQNKLYTDNLTSLASRFAFLEDLSLIKDKIPIIFLLNIDSFRIYNELYGVDVGNEVLIGFSNILKEFIKDTDSKLYRISGDEFVFYEEADFIDIEKYEDVLEKLFDFISQNKVHVKSIDEKIEISVTVGISFSNENPLGKADMAMYDAKKNGEKFSTHSLHTDTTEQLKNILYWKKEIKSALKENRVVPYFQPIVDREQKIIKYESLMRIVQYDDDTKEEKVISPFHFLDIAIRTKQYLELSYRLIENAITLMENKNISLSINLDMQDLYNSTLMRMLKKKVTEFNRSNKGTENKIILEILENDKIVDYDSLQEQLEDLKLQQALIAIDDFGSGYSNFSHIIGISPNYLKIDGSLIKHIHSDSSIKRLVESIVLFAKKLGMKTIAEFVATKEIFDIAYELGVDEFQGYYFGKPAKIEEIE